MNIPDVGFEHAVSGNFTVPAILAHSGIRGEEDTLLILDPALLNDFPNFQENTIILYNFGKMAGKHETCSLDKGNNLLHAKQEN